MFLEMLGLQEGQNIDDEFLEPVRGPAYFLLVGLVLLDQGICHFDLQFLADPLQNDWLFGTVLSYFHLVLELPQEVVEQVVAEDGLLDIQWQLNKQFMLALRRDRMVHVMAPPVLEVLLYIFLDRFRERDVIVELLHCGQE